MEQCLTGPVVLIDLAVPRDIDPRVQELQDVQLYDIDCFREEACSEEQKAAILKAEDCFAEQMEEFYVWYECRDMIPKIQEIKENAAVDLELRLQKKLRELPLENEQREQLKKDIEAAAVKTFNKMLFGLRDGVGKQTFRETLECLEQLYQTE